MATLEPPALVHARPLFKSRAGLADAPLVTLLPPGFPALFDWIVGRR